MSKQSATLFLRGVFRLEDQDGQRVPVRSAKARGMLALLAISAKGERSRTWLQSMLWSDRAPEQASGSLRQTLTQLRKVLVPAGVHLETDRDQVALDLATIQVDTSGNGEFLEGLEIGDEAFEEWLTTERSYRDLGSDPATPRSSVATSSPDAWSLAIMTVSGKLSVAGGFELLFADTLARHLREVYAAPVQVGPPTRIGDWSLLAEVHCIETRVDSVVFRVAVSHPAAHHQVWSAFRELEVKGVPPVDNPELRQMVHDLVEALSDYLIMAGCERADPQDPDKLFRLGIRSLFTMDPVRVNEADELFARAYAARQRGLYLAWRMQLRAIQLIEKHAVDRDAIKEQGREFYAQAIALEPNNSMVMATLANSVRQIRRDDEHSFHLAERGVRLNPMNSFAWWALSSASVYAGDAEGAYRNAWTGRQIAALSPHRFWWDSQVHFSALLTGRTSVALNFAQAAHAANPEFKPPLRYLIALHASEGNLEKSLAAAEKLKRLEPDFTIERLLRDETYPASLIHSSPSIRKDRLEALI